MIDSAGIDADKGAINRAISALNAAYERADASHELLAIFAKAQVALEDLRKEIVAFDAGLEASEEPPTGDSYNKLMDILDLDAMQSKVMECDAGGTVGITSEHGM